jgi:hypothetical protein
VRTDAEELLPGLRTPASLGPDTVRLLQAAFYEDLEVARAAWVTLVREMGGTPAVIAWARGGAEQRLLPALGRRSEELELPEEAVRACRDATVEAWGLNERLLLLVRPAIERLVAAGIPVVALKGTALIGDVYEQHRLRPLGDVDLLVPRARVRDALRTLAQEGWVDPEPTRWLRTAAMHSVGLGGPIPSASIDLHWRATYATPHRMSRQPWPAQDLEPVPTGHPLADTGLQRPRAARLLVMLTVHGTNQWGNPSAHWIGDAAALLRMHPEVDGAEVGRIAAEDGLSLQVREGLRLVHDVLGVALPFSPRALDPPTRRAERDERRRWSNRARARALMQRRGAVALARRLLIAGRVSTLRGHGMAHLHVLTAAVATRVHRRLTQRRVS